MQGFFMGYLNARGEHKTTTWPPTTLRLIHLDI